MAEHFVRHGQTDWNLEHKIQGRIDIGLNAEGRVFPFLDAIRREYAGRDVLLVAHGVSV